MFPSRLFDVNLFGNPSLELSAEKKKLLDLTSEEEASSWLTALAIVGILSVKTGVL